MYFRRYVIKELQINNQIRFPKVRLIDVDGEQLGMFTSADAQKRADEQGLDLVLLSPNANPPVCRIMDYSKFKYEQIKKQKEAKKNAKTVNVQEIRLSPTIQQHDLEIKAKNASKIIKKEDKVKVSIRFRGREMAHKDLGKEVLDKFFELVSDIAQISSKPKMEGRSMQMIIEPKSE
ncbi:MULTISPECIES: translation initiation factor IF-3 [Helcococcus]|uniref:Translation initiation factor IF-3 n=2 Tax=Helcococcus TaxID=31983 RepID=A0A4R9C3A0_9FIRM|nr:translation initiation factor IF-3 [Helcococcus ovis]TFF64061.1 translation initiation factor IF-3 [Helcococcus ovis]TFF65812.1 translation initiation factor IF-3 [Helcococcus ovis]TFF68892.1 translation initiation factor IF-3 [Helcococcus ovis]WNZ02068.1 translation initiation factor IF-3 [Helcococcus ovis]